METPDMPEAHRPHTGRNWLDILLALSALLVSCISLGVAVHHGDVMKKLVEANQHMVQANSWPLLQFDSVLTGEQVEFRIQNKGVGPARLRAMEVFVDDEPVGTIRDAITACCAEAVTKGKPLAVQGSSAQSDVLAQRDRMAWLVIQASPDQPQLIQAMLGASQRFHQRACYCSVFDECWMIDSRDDGDPKPVAQCSKATTPWVAVDFNREAINAKASGETPPPKPSE